MYPVYCGRKAKAAVKAVPIPKVTNLSSGSHRAVSQMFYYMDRSKEGGGTYIPVRIMKDKTNLSVLKKALYKMLLIIKAILLCVLITPFYVLISFIGMIWSLADYIVTKFESK